jgi:hypothetical protein
MWPPNGIPSSAPRTPPTLGAWDGEPAAHRRRATPQQPAGTTAQASTPFTTTPMPTSTCHWAFQIAEDDRRGRERDPPTAEVYARTIAQLDAELAQTRQAATARYHTRAIEQTDDEDNGPQTCRWSDSSPSRGCGHTPRAQERYSPTAEYHASTIMRLEATVDTYTRALERVEDNDCGPQTT